MWHCASPAQNESAKKVNDFMLLEKKKDKKKKDFV